MVSPTETNAPSMQLYALLVSELLLLIKANVNLNPYKYDIIIQHNKNENSSLYDLTNRICCIICIKWIRLDFSI